MPERRSILIIDDDPDLLELLAWQLTQEGFVVTAMSSGERGLQAVDAQRFDVILLDMLMPNQDGLVIAEALRSRPNAQQVPVILMTAMANETYWEVLPNDTRGPGYVMGKACAMDLFIARITEVLARPSES